MGVLALPGNSSLIKFGAAERGVLADAERADNSDGKVAVTGVVNCASFGLAVGMMTLLVPRGCDEETVIWSGIFFLFFFFFFLKSSE